MDLPQHRFFMVPAKPLHNLGEIQRLVLLAYGRGQTFLEIAAERGVTYSTIKNQIEAARHKLGGRRSFDAYLKLVALEEQGPQASVADIAAATMEREQKEREYQAAADKVGQLTSCVNNLALMVHNADEEIRKVVAAGVAA